MENREKNKSIKNVYNRKKFPLTYDNIIDKNQNFSYDIKYF